MSLTAKVAPASEAIKGEQTEVYPRQLQSYLQRASEVASHMWILPVTIAQTAGLLFLERRGNGTYTFRNNYINATYTFIPGPGGEGGQWYKQVDGGDMYLYDYAKAMVDVEYLFTG